MLQSIATYMSHHSLNTNVIDKFDLNYVELMSS